MNNRRVSAHLALVLGLLLLAAPAVVRAAGADAAKDIRILIDISGSMKQNDPHRLRAPALRLLTGLLPQDARAGVWTYAQYVNMLVPHGTVDAHWKERAQQAAVGINSAGLFTNIEEVLVKASAGWQAADPGIERHLIMLTDGLVDVAPDPALNAASRERVVNEVLPQLRERQVKVHTIALSAGADQALLRQLAAATGGWYEQVDNADGLQRVFLRLFEKTAKPDTLPLTANTVKVDASIREMTFLMFHKADEELELVTPAGKTLSAAQAPAAVRWHRDTGYDLVTITQPEAGDWHIRGTEDKDNRVVVVTDLKVRATTLPNNLYVDDLPYYFVQLTQQGTVIRRQEFLDLLNVSLQLGAAGAPPQVSRLLDDGKAPDVAAADGTFSYRVAAPLAEGRYELRLLVDGTTFQREQRQELHVYAQPAAASVQPDPTGAGRYVLAVVPHAGLIDTQTMQVSATVTGPDGKATELALAQTGPAEWRQEIAVDEAKGQYTASFTVQGMRPDGKAIDRRLDKITFGAGGVAVVAETPAPAPAEPETAEVAAAADEAPPAAADADADVAEAGMEAVNWFTVAWQALLINAVVLPLGYFAYRKWARSSRPPATPVIEEAET